ncbi:Putative ribonuclease H protein At1g65750 [Linum grandiflorum]
MLRVANALLGISRAPAHSPFRVLARNWHKKVPIPVHWERPENGWTKLNFDGSCKGRKGVSSIGGVVRNHRAEFLLGYAEPISTTGSVVAELAALRRGLELVLENGWNNVWLEGDAKSVVEVIMRPEKEKRLGCVVAKRHVRDINMIIPEIENCIVSHIYREGNRAADKFAQMGHGLEEPKVWRHDPPDDDILLRIVREDAVGKIIIRRR